MKLKEAIEGLPMKMPLEELRKKFDELEKNNKRILKLQLDVLDTVEKKADVLPKKIITKMMMDAAKLSKESDEVMADMKTIFKEAERKLKGRMEQN